MRVESVIMRPLVTEKSTLSVASERKRGDLRGRPGCLQTHDVRRAVEQLFSVRVADVARLRMPRKTRRVGRFIGRGRMEKRVVRLAEGQSIEFFEGV